MNLRLEILCIQKGKMIDQNTMTQIFSCTANALPAYFYLSATETWAKVNTFNCGVEGGSILASVPNLLHFNLIIEKLQANSCSFTEFLSGKK